MSATYKVPRKRVKTKTMKWIETRTKLPSPKSYVPTTERKPRASSALDAPMESGGKIARNATRGRDSGVYTASGVMIVENAAAVLMEKSRGVPSKLPDVSQ